MFAPKTYVSTSNSCRSVHRKQVTQSTSQIPVLYNLTISRTIGFVKLLMLVFSAISLCFYFSQILDEVYRILSHIKKSPNLGRAYKVTDELFDLSSMAMEYFKEHIEPRLPEITYFGSDFLDITSRFSGGYFIPLMPYSSFYL